MSAFGPTDWDVSVLDRPMALDADRSGLSGPLAAEAAACLAAMSVGDAAKASERAGVLGRAGVVAVRSGGRAFEVLETQEGWELSPSEVPTPDPEDLAAAARVWAALLYETRRAGGGRP